MATSEGVTVRGGIEFLENGMVPRSLRENLAKFSPGGDVRKILVDGLVHNHLDSHVSRESTERRVRGWMRENKIQTLRKLDAIEVCFIFGLNIDRADGFVALVSGERLHWRNPDEIVYLFALKQGMDYREAKALNVKLQEVLSQAKEAENLSEDSFTPIIRQEIEKINTREELADYLKEAAPRMGRYHNTAYQLFMEMMEVLKHPEQYGAEVGIDFQKEDKVNVRSILRDYLYTGEVRPAKKKALDSKKNREAVPTGTSHKDGEAVPTGTSHKDGERDFTDLLSQEEKLVWTDIHRQVSKGWPDETILSKMKFRKVDVSRKVLILLFLATDPQDEDMEEEDDPDFILSEEDLFEDLYWRLNHMLARCGFLPLDPRSPFDWLILYCICAGDLLEVDERMRGIFQEMFGGKNQGN